MGFGSDGASVMTGRVSGVAARLSQSNPYLVAIHCVAHRLALACSQAGERIAYIQKFKKALTTLYWFFQASAVRTAGLKAIQEMFDTPSLKLKEAKDVRWLSHDLAVQTLRRSLPAVLTALEREGAEHGEPVAMGLVKVMKCYQFVACLHLMSEVLPHLSHPSRLFQAEYIQLSMVRPYLNVCIESLTSYKDAVRAPYIAAFDKNVRQPFLNLLLQNLTDRFPRVELLSAFSIFDPSLSCSATEADKEKAAVESREKLEILSSHYSTRDDAPLQSEELHKEWESFAVMLVDHYDKAKARDVLHDLASEKLQAVYPQLPRLACLGLTIGSHGSDSH